MRKLTQRDLQSAERHYLRIMEILNIPTTDENSKDTPKRYVKMLAEMTNGMDSWGSAYYCGANSI